jgi:hypothetical protein
MSNLKGIKVRIQVDVDGSVGGLQIIDKRLTAITRSAANKGGSAAAKEAKRLAPVRDVFVGKKKSIRKGALLIKNKGRYRTYKEKQGDQVVTKYRGGLLKKAIGFKVKRYKKVINVAIVGVRHGFRQQIGVVTRGGKPNMKMSRKKPRKVGQPIYADPVKYIHLIDRGTRNTKANPIIEPASRVGGNICLEQVNAGLESALQEAARA